MADRGACLGAEHTVDAPGFIAECVERFLYTAHGFRSSFRDWVSEETNHPSDVAEAALAHIVANKTEAAYRRGDAFEKRRRLMDDWAALLAGQVTP